MKKLWIRLRKGLDESRKKKLLEEVGDKLSGVICEDEGDVALARAYDIRRIASPLGADFVLVNFRDLEKERSKLMGKRVMIAFQPSAMKDINFLEENLPGGAEYLLVESEDWRVIPLENVIARFHGKLKILAKASNSIEAKTFLETLELGADGIVVDAQYPEQIEEFWSVVEEVSKPKAVVREEAIAVPLVRAKVVDVKPVGMGARVCVDTCDLLSEGEGLLVGSQASGLFLIQAEVEDTPHTAARPFRVNAGPVSSYTLTPDGTTKYLSELSTGDKVLVVSRKGETKPAIVGRTKIEWRPMVMVVAEYEGSMYKTIVQEAETIKFVTPNGAKAVTELKPGDEVLMRVEEGGGRHFGVLVKEERIIER